MVLQLTECIERLEPTFIRRSFCGVLRVCWSLSEVLWRFLDASRSLFVGLWRHLALERVIFSDSQRIFGGLGDAFWARKSAKSGLKMDITISTAFKVDFSMNFDQFLM